MLLLKYIFESSICRAPEGFMELLPSMMRRTVIYKLIQTQWTLEFWCVPNMKRMRVWVILGISLRRRLSWYISGTSFHKCEPKDYFRLRHSCWPCFGLGHAHCRNPTAPRLCSEFGNHREAKRNKADKRTAGQPSWPISSLLLGPAEDACSLNKGKHWGGAASWEPVALESKTLVLSRCSGVQILPLSQRTGNRSKPEFLQLLASFPLSGTEIRLHAFLTLYGAHNWELAVTSTMVGGQTHQRKRYQLIWIHSTQLLLRDGETWRQEVP